MTLFRNPFEALIGYVLLFSGTYYHTSALSVPTLSEKIYFCTILKMLNFINIQSKSTNQCRQKAENQPKTTKNQLFTRQQ